MSGRLPRGQSTEQRGGDLRARRPLLDRLLDDAPADRHDPPLSANEAHTDLLRGVRRDLEALLNARRPWRTSISAVVALTIVSKPIEAGAGSAFNCALIRSRNVASVRRASTNSTRTSLNRRSNVASAPATSDRRRSRREAWLKAPAAKSGRP